jgi:hypothetical protein
VRIISSGGRLGPPSSLFALPGAPGTREAPPVGGFLLQLALPLLDEDPHGARVVQHGGLVLPLEADSSFAP